jgi:acyl-CoA synthetase (AMP-forming)/AMP-acid ligase II
MTATPSLAASGLNFGELARRATILYPEKTALVQDDFSVTYGELEERTRRAASLFATLGVGPGVSVVLLFPNDWRFAECLLGVLRAGGVAVPANTKLGSDTLAYLTAHSDASVLVVHEELIDKASEVLKSAPTVRHTLVVGGDAPFGVSYDDVLAEASPEFATVPVEADALALLMYTSGSTGRPKGCMLSHANKWFQARSSARVMFHDEGDRALVMGPLYHANAFWACMLPMLFVGGSLVILPGFEAVPVLEAIDRHRPTYTSGTPSMFSLVLEEEEAFARLDVSSIELLLCGSAPVPEELMNAIIARFGCDVVESYGLTEGGANVVTPRWGVKKIGSTGLPVPGVKIRIADVEDPARDCEPGEVGELWSRSPANALGYFKDPETTAAKFTADGWLKTGDLVHCDEQGYVFIAGRLDDMINCGGENVYPKEVETILLEHPAIVDVCVVPADHPVKGQAPVAWVVSRGNSLTEADVKEFFLDRGPAYAHPRRVFFIDKLPLSSTNKLDRSALESEVRRLLPNGLETRRSSGEPGAPRP